MTEDRTTDRLAEYVGSVRPADLPSQVRREARRAILNYIGCAIGGARHPSIVIMDEALSDFSGRPEATVIGRPLRRDAMTAALINAVGGCVDAFCDTHGEANIHPSAPVIAAALAVAEKQQGVRGDEFLAACALGLEVACRLSMAVSIPPARGSIAWSQTGIAGGVGAAVAAARIMGLDFQRMKWAIGIAAIQALGYRSAQATMTMPLMHGHGAVGGLRAAVLARAGFTGPDPSIEGQYGFASMFAETPNLAAVTVGLGSDFEVLRLTYKPYPCGIFIHPVIDVCQRVHAMPGFTWRDVESVRLGVSRECANVTGVRHPLTTTDAQFSLYHWAAVALVHGTARMSDRSVERIAEEPVARLRDVIEAEGSERFGSRTAEALVRLRAGRQISIGVEQCVGSVAQPMSDADLEKKFRGLAEGAIPDDRIEAVIRGCAELETSGDAAAVLHPTRPDAVS